ncbi:hypothetical protein BN2476_210155 [Paraburkholderia piptadeniae]|uniref:Uncharacterized protein n=1 Tax=Paraburkholderia piptadeniae TaxID=1701573 RepID=A0A1N7RW69_9BURK|nr:hypothetical protein BN2476_210155 [Paraburkholderia piptadeniae]
MEQETIDASSTGAWNDFITEATIALARTHRARWWGIFVGKRRIELEIAASVSITSRYASSAGGWPVLSCF